MNSDKNLNELLKWSIQNSTEGKDGEPPKDPSKGLTPELLASLMGGPSDADLMIAALQHLHSKDPEITLESKLTAFDNLEQLIESLDNANLLAKLGLWTPLLELLDHPESEIRLMAAWCVGTAVQNNSPCQERLVALGGVERLVSMALGQSATTPQTEDSSAATTPAEQQQQQQQPKDVRRKAVYALSSAVRNYQPAMDTALRKLKSAAGDDEKLVDPAKLPESIDASDMEAVDGVIGMLKEKATSAAA